MSSHDRYALPALPSHNRRARLVGTRDPAIDVVFTHVDAADPAWRAKFARAAGNAHPESKRVAPQADEVYWSLLTIEAFMPWVRRVHVVTDDQPLDPARLTPWARARVADVRHAHIIPARLLPTFNPMVIQAWLHAIPGLSDVFVYFHDDVFVGRPHGPEAFITREGVPRMVTRPAPRNVEVTPDRPWVHWTKNAVDAFVAQFHMAPAFGTLHTPHVMRRQACMLTWSLFERELEAAASPLRTPRSLHFIYLAQAVAAYFGLASMARAEPGLASFVTCGMEGTTDTAEALRHIARTRPAFFCVADMDAACAALFRPFMRAYLEDAGRVEAPRRSAAPTQRAPPPTQRAPTSQRRPPSAPS